LAGVPLVMLCSASSAGRPGAKLGHFFQARLGHRALVHGDRGRLFAAANARRCNHPHAIAQYRGQLVQQLLRALQFTGQAIAHAHRERSRILALAQEVKVVIKARDLMDLGHGDVHLAGQCDQVPLMQTQVGVLQKMQVLDEQVTSMATFRPRAKQRTHLIRRQVIALAAFEAGMALASAPQALQTHGGQSRRRRWRN